jgi:hypothetical protein
MARFSGELGKYRIAAAEAPRASTPTDTAPARRYQTAAAMTTR